eukprot:Sspe_Gene.93958::Locus_66445_Transcript_1_1_Confidence_1.000_Length_413::g.93958::m.93958
MRDSVVSPTPPAKQWVHRPSESLLSSCEEVVTPASSQRPLRRPSSEGSGDHSVLDSHHMARVLRTSFRIEADRRDSCSTGISPAPPTPPTPPASFSKVPEALSYPLP